MKDIDDLRTLLFVVLVKGIHIWGKRINGLNLLS
jgi:hypothetical protein